MKTGSKGVVMVVVCEVLTTFDVVCSLLYFFGVILLSEFWISL